IGRTWQCGTIQLDFQMPINFELEYVDENGEKQRPIMVHRVVYGSIERFIGILTEHYAGKFPLWLAPTQVKILPVSEKFEEYSKEIYQMLKDNGVRVELDLRSEKIGYKIREAQAVDRAYYMLIIGQREQDERTVSARNRNTGETATLTLSDFVETCLNEIKTRKM
ncbi:MAG: threonine--tRNA ligase, partial [Clostridia bacterium]|nr:threonine--tRNA ligase [Clostridia bacterium]